MLGRRKALMAIMTSPVTAKAVITQAAAQAATITAAMGADNATREPGLDCEVAGSSSGHEIWRFFDNLEQEYYDTQRPVEQMPNGIAAKKSWSPAFKSYCFIQEERKRRAMMTALRNDHEMAEKVAKMLGFKA